MENFTPVASGIGGLLIGISAALLLFANGKIAGISGIAGGLLTKPPRGDVLWRVVFVVGLLAGGLSMGLMRPELFTVDLSRSTPALAAAGLLVGFGTRLGSGCTSGHGVCGLSRMSQRSLVSVLTFMGAGVLTVLAINLLFGGAL